MKEAFKSNIFVRNVPKEITEEEFKDKMTEAGKIVSVRLKDMTTDVDGEIYVKNKTGYACFERVEEAQKCIKLFDESHKFGWGGPALKVDFWQSKFDLKHETEEKNINQVKKFIKFIQQDMQDQQHK
jgi:RNA recognition motif-containing protein